jgi:hypothetical protein
VVGCFLAFFCLNGLPAPFSTPLSWRIRPWPVTDNIG